MKSLILSFFILVGSCHQKNIPKEGQEIEIEEEVEKITESEYTILKFDAGWKWIFKNAQPTEFTKSEIIEVDKIIKVAIKENNLQQIENLKEHNSEYPKYTRTETGFELDLTNGYHRQYVPVINENGEKIIWVNFFCQTFNKNWKNELILVNDGGNCFFNIKINLSKKSYSELRINGYA